MEENSFSSPTLPCRLCAEVPGTIDLWNYNDKNFDCDILSAVKNHLFVQIFQDEQVCEDCLNQVRQWEQFFTKCQSAQKKFKKFLGTAGNPNDCTTKNVRNNFNTNEESTGAAASDLIESHYRQVPDESIHIQETSCDQTLISLKEVIVASSSEQSLNSVPKQSIVGNSISLKAGISVNGTEKTKKKRERKGHKKDSEETEEENANSLNSRVAKVILTFEQIEERVGRSLDEDEASNVRTWIESKNNRQIFKFIYGHGDDRLWLCHICQQQVRGRYTELRRHCYEEHHSKLMYSCELCTKKFAYIRQYKRHLEKHFNSNSSVDLEDAKSDLTAEGGSTAPSGGSFICEICGRVLKQKNCLIKHMLTHLPEDRKNVHFCDVCGKGFPALGMLTSHKNRVHIEGRPYTCKTCGKSYKTQRSWKDHCEAHLGNRIFVCTVCQMKLSSRQCLKLHMLTHTGEKPFQCDVCKRHYHSKSRMLRHKRITHNPNPQFICDVCGKAFRSRTGIEGHKLEHTGEVPNVCPICGKAIRAKSNFYAHLKVHRQQADREAETASSATNTEITSKRSRQRKSTTIKEPPSSVSSDPVASTTFTFNIAADTVDDSTYLTAQNIQLHDASILTENQPTSATLLTYETARFDVDCVAGTVAIYASDSGPDVTDQQYTYLTPTNPGDA